MFRLPRDPLFWKLLRAGLSVSHARRVVGEIRDHRQELLAAARARGLEPAAAEAAALTEMGDEARIVEQFAARTELRAWRWRHPLLAFVGVPVAGVVLGFAAFALLIVFSIERVVRFANDAGLAENGAAALQAGMNGVFVWFLPLVGCWIVARSAAVHAKASRWPLVGVLFATLWSIIAKVDVQIHIGTAPGTNTFAMGMGFDVIPGVLPLLRGVLILAVASAIYLGYRRRYARFAADLASD